MAELSLFRADSPPTRPHRARPRLGAGTTLRMRSASETGGGGRASVARMIGAYPGLDFDICEMPLVNYISAKEHGAKFTAIPARHRQA